LQKSLAKAYLFARTFAAVGNEVMNIGYARVSTLDQNLDLQMQALRKEPRLNRRTASSLLVLLLIGRGAKENWNFS
jgi:hypothetical protein